MPSHEPLLCGRRGVVLPVDEDFPGDHAAYLTERLVAAGMPQKVTLADRVDLLTDRFLDGVSFWGLVVAGGVGVLCVVGMVVVAVLRMFGVVR